MPLVQSLNAWPDCAEDIQLAYRRLAHRRRIAAANSELLPIAIDRLTSAWVYRRAATASYRRNMLENRTVYRVSPYQQSQGLDFSSGSGAGFDQADSWPLLVGTAAEAVAKRVNKLKMPAAAGVHHGNAGCGPYSCRNLCFDDSWRAKVLDHPGRRCCWQVSCW